MVLFFPLVNSLQGGILCNFFCQLKLILVCQLFLVQGHWTRIAEQVAGGLKYKPPRHDINAPDLYLPLMAFATYIMLCGFTLGQAGKYVPYYLCHVCLIFLSLNERITPFFFVWLSSLRTVFVE
jgi:hypothetical protein